MTCVIKDDGNFYPQLFLEEALYKKMLRKRLILEKELSDLNFGRFDIAMRIDIKH